MSQTLPVSVVVCVKGEERRIEDCLRSIQTNQPDEIIVVDGNSTDRTAELARGFTDKVIITKSSNLTRDRQVGIDAAKNDLIAMVDADHRLKPGDLQSLMADLEKYDLAIVQSQLVSYENLDFWNAAEEQAWFLTHNKPGPRSMIGTAPALYKREVFNYVRFDDRITEKIDDTDFIYRLSRVGKFRIGIGETRVQQLHFGTTSTYFKKFMWYGHGDGEFCRKHPNRAGSMLFHILVRYPLIYSTRAAKEGKWKAIPYFVFQGGSRFLGLTRYFLQQRPKQRKKEHV